MNKNISNPTNKSMNINTIAFSKGFLFAKDYKKEEISFDYPAWLNVQRSFNHIILAMQAELMRYGYMLSTESLFCLSKLEDDDLNDIANELATYLGNTYGDGCFVSLFGNFPQTVMHMSEAEMFFHQIVHYLSNGAYSPAMPSCDDTELKLLHDRYDGVVFRDSYKLIEPISKGDFVNYFKKILSAQQSLTSYDKDAISYIIDNYSLLVDNVKDLIPEEVPFKETYCMLLSKIDMLYPKTASDVLRYAVYLSDGDISLPKIPTDLKNYGWMTRRFNDLPQYLQDTYKSKLTDERQVFRFKKFSRAERRRILGMIEHILSSENAYDNVLADMKKYAGRWVRLGEILHPGEYAKKFPETANAFVILRNSQQYISTYYGRIEAARKVNDFELLLNIYTERPGEFARNLDNLLRNYPDSSAKTIIAFSKVLSKISTKMLYELIEHFNVRNDLEFRNNRYVFVKGARNAVKLPELQEMNPNVLAFLINMLVNELEKRHAAFGSLANKFYIIDNNLANIALPKNMRSMNIAPGQIARGSVLPIKTNTGIFRCYCRWVDKIGNQDLDLSTTMYDENFKYLTAVSWSTYYKQDDWAVFSGDVRHRVGNCAEYIDIDINGAKKAGVRYIVASVCDYDGSGFAKKDAWAGVMERSSMGTPGETTWAPKTITTGFKLSSSCTYIAMTIIDLEKMIMYVVDEDIDGIPVASTQTEKESELIKRYVNSKRYFNAKSLIEFSIGARGGIFTSANHDDIETYKKEINDYKVKLTTLKQEYEDEISSVHELSDLIYVRNQNELCDKLAEIDDALAEINNIEFVSYDDIAADYTKLFEWMF